MVTEKTGNDNLTKKHVGNVKYEDITLHCGTGMSRAFYEWIKGAFENREVRKNGAIVGADYNYKEQTRLEFNNALISEVALPALDASSKDAAKMTIKISPEITRSIAKAGTQMRGPEEKVQKKWLPANFRLTMTNLDCSKVNKIDPIVLKRKAAGSAGGQMRNYEQEPANLQVPNLVITVPESHSAAFYKWHEDFVIKGNTKDGEKSGALEYFSPNMEALFTLDLRNIGIFKISPDKSTSEKEAVKHLRVEMYCEEIRFNYGNSAWA